MTKRVGLGVLLLAIGYAAGILAPHASAADPTQGIVTELRGIKAELTTLRRVMEKATN